MIDRHSPGTTKTPAPADLRNGPATLWQLLCGQASPARQRELLALARGQGVLYAHQLPPTGNGTPADRGRQLLNTLLEAADGLEPVRVAPLEPIDSALDDHQREAVAKGLATPDICLLQGLPGTGKSRAVVELVLQAVRCGERILLASPSSAALDCVLEQVAGHPSVFAIRCLDAGEKLEALPAAVQALTLERRLHGLRDDGLATLRQEVVGLQAAAGRCREQQAILARCREALEQQQEIERQVAELHQQRQGMPAEVEQAAAMIETAGGSDELARSLSPYWTARCQARSRLEPALAKVRQQHADRRQEQERLDGERAPLQALADARQGGRWWTLGWWRARFAGAGLARLGTLDAENQRLETELANLAAEECRLLPEQAAVEERYQSERRACCAAEVSRRRAGLDERLGELAAKQRQVEEQWQSLAIHLERPPARDLAAVRAAVDACQQEQRRQAEQAAFSQEWIECLSQRGESLTSWLASAVNVAALPVSAVCSDPHLGETARPGLAFDLAVVEEAQRLTEADLVKLARRARRLVLVADADEEAEPRRKSERSPPTPTVFQRLWQRLHCDPRRLPYAWLSEAGRLCCRLRPCAAEQRQYLECERLADCPDIELRILTLPRTPPALAEVVFPPTMSIGQAKEYIYRELQELPVHALGHSFRWQEEADRLVLRLTDSPATSPVPVVLERGIRELIFGPVANAPAATCGIEFDRSAGWDRPRAEEWLRQHLGARDLGRTVCLDHPYRMGPELAAVVADILFAGGYPWLPSPLGERGRGEGAALAANGQGAAVEFVAVPPLSQRVEPQRLEKPVAGRKIATAGRGRVARNGAGLELDLADPRQRARLPADVRDQLPTSGVVNYFEAQAVVRKLEALAKQVNGQASIGVLALYPAQAVLIRTLVRQSPRLAGLELAIGTPETFRQRESAVMLVSLTRSHTTRAVPYGESPAQLAVALTRARHQLILFGDPGTLARRCQWDKAVDHLDESAAAREREVVSRLCEYLQGKGSHARAFHFDEGIGP